MYTLTYEVFPLPLGPIMAFRPGFIDPLEPTNIKKAKNTIETVKWTPSYN